MAIKPPQQISNQRISALHADSTVAALVVHSVDASGAYVSPGAGSTQVSVKEILTAGGQSVMDSTNNAIGVTIRAGSAAGTEYTDGDTDLTPNGGAIFFNNGSNTMRAVSALTPLPISGSFSASTIVTIAALPLISSAAPAGNSSALTVRIAGGPSSAVDAKFAIGAVRDSGNAELLDSTRHALRVCPPDGSAIEVNVQNAQVRVSQGVGNSSGVDAWPISVTDSSNAIVKPGDGANNAIRVNVVAGSAAGSTIVSVAALPLISSAVAAGNSSALTVRNVWSSTNTDQPVSAAQSGTWTFGVNAGSNLIGQVNIATPVSSAVASAQSSAVLVRIVGGPSSAVDVQFRPVFSSTNTDNPVRALFSSTKADNLVTVYQSTRSEVLATVYQSSASEFQATVTPFAGSTWATRPLQSSAADLQMTATLGTNLQSTTTQNSGSSGINVRIIDGCSSAANFKTASWTADGAGNSIESSTKAVGVTNSANSTMRGLAVRSLMPSLTSFASSNTFTSSAATIATSNAATVGYVYAYSITSTNQTPTKVGFYTGAGTLLWPVVLAAISSAVTGVNLAVSPPAYLFKGATGTALTLNIPSSGVGWKVGVSYWTE